MTRRIIYSWMASGKVETIRTAGGSVRIFVDTLWRTRRTSIRAECYAAARGCSGPLPGVSGADPRSGGVASTPRRSRLELAGSSEKGQARVHARDDARMRRSDPRSWEDRPLAERCIQYRPLPRLPTGYNNHYQIFQTPGAVVLLTEMIHHVRVIPLGDRPHIDPKIRLWNGDSRGHWEGDTLVVETTNFSDKTSFRWSGANLHLIERFTRTGPDRVVWEFTVEDATIWTRPWTGGIPFRRVEGPVFEYACHEGNYAMATMLRGSRVNEQAATVADPKDR